ncbi:hypothetical protein [Xylocopilactobacillus apicola]|uniref:Secreted protein n=1 Tax=Xylocopilactobacillus apicola TaxID=2932184 RepID=A0AAU9CY28_9LACO|nr:hypothetical protein [Xylocopilactobacillus apicola]BDR58942.1 hypothetical protein XA3_13830 [Xylocopilactobacillus apicola]
MYRRPEKKKKNSSLTIITVITIAVLLFLIMVLTASLRTMQADKSKETPIQSTSSTQSSSAASSLTVASSSSKNQDNVNPSKTPTSVVITDLNKYNDLDGNYKTIDGALCTLSFDQKIFTQESPGKQQVYYFDKVMRHPDETLVINVSGDYHYNAYDGKGDQTMKMYLSLLLAPPGNTVRKNWQTGDEINDVTNKDVARFAIASSNDNGKTFNMTPAYRNFETDGHASQNQQSELFLFNSEN